MSWVIARHLYKSGNNNIHWRIGNYNKFSYSRFHAKKQISDEFISSDIYKFLQQKEFLLGETWRKQYKIKRILRLIDIYTRNKRMSFCVRPKILLRNKINMQREWGNIYGYEITDVIFKNCKNIQTLNRKYKYEFSNGCHIKKFNQLSWTIIQKNKRLSSFSRIISNGEIPFLSEFSAKQSNSRLSYWVRQKR